jgi:hypothetical protein
MKMEICLGASSFIKSHNILSGQHIFLHSSNPSSKQNITQQFKITLVPVLKPGTDVTVYSREKKTEEIYQPLVKTSIS